MQSCVKSLNYRGMKNHMSPKFTRLTLRESRISNA